MASELIYTITIRNTHVDADLTAVPVRVVLHNDSSVGDVCRADGFDVIFKNGVGGTLSFQRRSFSVVAGEANGVFIVFPDLDTDADTTISLWAGDAGASDTSSDTGWDANTLAVYTLGEAPTGSAGDFKDSTDNNNDSTNTAGQPTHSTGMLDGVARFESQYVEIGTGLTVGGTAMSIEGWFIIRAYAADNALICQRQENWQLISPDGSGHLQFCIWEGASQYNYTTTDAFPIDEWFHLVVTYDGTHVTFYKNGALLEQFDCTHTINTNSLATRFGNDLWGNYFQGKQTEIGLHNTARSAAWVEWRYYNTVIDNGQLVFTLGEMDEQSSSSSSPSSISTSSSSVSTSSVSSSSSSSLSSSASSQSSSSSISTSSSGWGVSGVLWYKDTTTGRTIKGCAVSKNRMYVWNGSEMVLWSTISLAQWVGGLISMTEQILSTSESTSVHVGYKPDKLPIPCTILYYSSPSSPSDTIVGTQELKMEELMDCGVVAADAGNTDTSFKTDLAGTDEKQYAGRVLVPVSGAAVNQPRRVTGFNAGTKVITVFPALSSVPDAGDAFTLLGFIEE